jgi:potassium efflux system protein
MVAASLALSADALSARAQKVEENQGLEEALRVEAARRYRLAADHLISAATLDDQLAELERQIKDAPAALEAARAELEKPIVDEPVELADDASLADLQNALVGVTAELEAARRRESELAEEKRERGEKRTDLPRQLADDRAALTELASRVDAIGQPAADDEALMSQRAELLAEIQHQEARIRSAQVEMRNIDARRDLLPARMELTARRTTVLSNQVVELQEQVNNRRREDAEKAARAAEDTQQELAESHPVVAKLAAETADLAALRTGPEGLAGRIERARQALDEVNQRLSHLREQAKTTRSKAEAAGFNQAIGLLLVSQRGNLPELDQHIASLRRRESEIADVQLAALDLEERRDALIDRTAFEREILESVASDLGSEQAKALEKTVKDLVRTKREYLTAAIRDYEALLIALIDLDASERSLIGDTLRYRDFIDENVLWIRGRSALSVATLEDSGKALNWLISPTNIRALGRAFQRRIADRPITASMLMLIWLLVLAASRTLKSNAGDYAQSARDNSGRSIEASFLLLSATVVMSLPGPGLLYLSGWMLGSVSGDQLEYTSAVVAGLKRVSVSFFFFEFGRQLCRKQGLGEVYLGWSKDRWLKRVRRAFPVALAVGLPALFVGAALNATGDQRWVDSLGRFAMVVTVLVLAGLTYTLLRPEKRSDAGAAGSRSVTNKWRSSALVRQLHLVATFLWIVLALMALAGWEYATLRFSELIMATVWTSLTLLLVDSISMRWIRTARRRLAIAQSRKRRELALRSDSRRGSEAGADFEASIAQESEVDLAAVNEQTQRLVRSVLALVLLGAMWVIWADVLPALRILDHIELWSVAGEDGSPLPITLANLLRAGLILGITIIAARNTPGFLEITFLQRLPLEPSVRYAITTVARYAIVMVGLVAGFAALRIGWSQVQWLAAAVSVGLGFGLQEIFANFVSGLIILFERPVRVGDTVTLGDTLGTVARIRMRATTIIDWDRRELIVPNKEFITGKLINWSLSDSITRLIISVGIAYGSDTRKAEELLYACAKDCQYVLDEPATTVVYREFGDSSLVFHVRVFIASMDHFSLTLTAMHFAIDEAFRASGIEIAFPQRDLHLRSASPLPVAVVQTAPTVPVKKSPDDNAGDE